MVHTSFRQSLTSHFQHPGKVGGVHAKCYHRTFGPSSSSVCLLSIALSVDPCKALEGEKKSL